MRPSLKIAFSMSVAAAALAPVATQAATIAPRTFDLGDLTTDPANGSRVLTVPKTGASTNFTDNFTFSFDAGGSNSQLYYASLVTKLGNKVASNIKSAALSLYDSANKLIYSSTVSSPDNMPFSKQLALAAGSYRATITGVANGTGTTIVPGGQSIAGTYTFSVTAPTPEPAGWASMMLGLGMVGYAVRRKKAGRSQDLVTA